MNSPQCQTVSELAHKKISKSATRLFESCYLHYNGPGSSGYGVKRTAMLMPETAMLMVAPMGCGRSGAVIGEKYGFADRMFYLNLDEYSVATGSYLKKMAQAVKYIAYLQTFKAVLICMTCIDALAGTDLVGLGAAISRDVGIPVTTTFMDPIVRDGNFGPMVQVRQAITACFKQGTPRHDWVNLLGCFADIGKDSELAELLRDAGITEILTVAGCKTFAQLQQMGCSSGNLIIHHQALACGQDLQKRLGMPYLELLPQYDESRIAKQYERLTEFMKVPLHYQRYALPAQTAKKEFTKRYAGIRIAIGEALSGNPFEIALTLMSSGVTVPFVMRDMVQPDDYEAICQLAAIAPDLPVYSGVHPSMWTWADSLPQADVALGLDAGYFLPQAISVGWPWDETYFGYEAATHLYSLLTKGISKPVAHQAQMSGSYLTV